MKNVIKIILFLTYTMSIFLIKQYQFPIIVLGINILLTLFLKISVREAISNIFSIIFFIILTMIINIIAVDIKTGIMIGIKLILVCNITFIFSKRINYSDLADALERIFSVLRFIKVNPKNVSIMICIGITFIPTLKRQIKQIQSSLKSKGIRPSIKSYKLMFEPLLTSLFKRVSEIENSLKSKAYEM